MRWLATHATLDFGQPDTFESDLGEPFLAWAPRELDRDALVVDVGTGRGRVAFHLAGLARAVAGLDVDEEDLAEARRRAAEAGVANVRFALADCESDDLRAAARFAQPVRLVTMRLCVSVPMLARASEALAAGGAVVGVAHEASRWHETGMPSRFAATRGDLEEAVRDAGLVLERARHDTSVLRLPDAAACEAYLRQGPSWVAWNNNGRWEKWRDRMAARPAGTPLELTRSHVSFLARKP